MGHTHLPLTPEELEGVRKEFEYIMERFYPKYKQYAAEGTLMAAIDYDQEFSDDGMVLMTLGEKIGISSLGNYLQKKMQEEA